MQNMPRRKRGSSSKLLSAERGWPGGISRMDQSSKRAHGFLVRTQYYQTKDGRYRPRYAASFPDKRYGGPEMALKAAVRWLKQVQASSKGQKSVRRGTKKRRKERSRPG